MRDWLGEQLDATHVHVFRVLFGLILAVAPVRFAAYGWIEALYTDPTFHFAWTRWSIMAPAPALYALHAAMAGAGLLIAWGSAYRPAVAFYALAFTYLESLDKTLYLNHYVLVTILLVTLLFAPYRPGHTHAPRWVRELLRLEFGLVWFWAGVCKLNPDWLFRAEPLHTWLRARMEIPVIGPWLARWETAAAMSWAGALFDLTIFFLLLAPRTRWLGFVLLTGFHFITGWLFPIGIFPWVMLAGALLFLPDGFLPRLRGRTWLTSRAGRVPQPTMLVLAAWVGLLALFPARHWLEPGWVNWNERGFRFAWRVLLIEKTGQVDYKVVDRATGRRWTVNPATELSILQHKQMRTQPDMILDYAHHIADRNRAEGRDVEVYAESFASLNGRRTQRLIDPEVDLAVTRYGDDGWIVPLE